MVLKYKIAYPFVFIISFAILWGFNAVKLSAEEYWVAYTDYAQLYQTRLPYGYKTTETQLLLGSDAVALVQSIHATVNADSTDGSDKTYKMEISQTLGNPINSEDFLPILEDQITAYLNKFVQYDATILEQKFFDISSGVKAGDVHIAYNDPVRGPSHLKTRIYLSSVSRIQQSVLGSKASIHSFRSKGFFDSTAVYDGYFGTEKTLRDSWMPYLSPLNIFTARLPEPDHVFVKEKPSIRHSKRYERLSFQFIDPFLKKSLTYNIHGYRINTERLNSKQVIQILQKNHLKKSYISLKNLAFRKLDANTIEAIYPSDPSKLNNFSTTGRLRANFVKNYLLVHEFWGPENIVNGSNFLENVIGSVDFHPHQAERLYKEALLQAKPAQPAPIE